MVDGLGSVRFRSKGRIVLAITRAFILFRLKFLLSCLFVSPPIVSFAFHGASFVITLCSDTVP